MPGRTLATWFGSGRDLIENNQPSDSHSIILQGSSHYEEHHQYGYYHINQGDLGNNNTFPEHPQQSQQPPHSPASPVTSPGSYYSSRLSSPAGHVSVTHHGMNYSNPQQQQALYSSSALSPNHYGSPNHGQHSGYSPTNNNSSGSGGSNQQWQSSGDYSQHHSIPSPQHSSVGLLSASPTTLTSSPSPSRVHTSTPPLTMSGQYPAHHHGRHPPMGSPPQPGQGHNLSSWGHHGGGQGMGMHPGAGMGGPPQGPGYYPPPHHSLVGPSRGLQGPPQHAHMASSVPVPGDRRSPMHPPSPGSWNSLSSVSSAASKGPSGHDGNVRGPPPPSSHPQQNNSGSSSSSSISIGGTGGNPLFSLQMLVNQDINRAAAAAVAAAQSASYRASTPSAPIQQESVDLSSGGAGSDAYSRMPPQQLGPIPLTRTDKQPPMVAEHLALRNGSIITSTSAVISNTPPTPLNGEVSCDSATETPTSSGASQSGKPLVSPVDTKAVIKEPVSVIAQTPPREKPKLSPVVSGTSSPQESSESKSELTPDDSELSERKDPSPELEDKEQLVKPVSEESVERCNPVIMSSTSDSVLGAKEQTPNIVSSSSCGLAIPKQLDDGLSVPTSSPGSKDSTSPVRSPKSGNLKRAKKVDSILENLVECGTKKLGGNASAVPSPSQSALLAQGAPAIVGTAPAVTETPSTTAVVVTPASVIVSPVATSEDSSSCHGREMHTPSPGEQQMQQTAGSARDEEAVSPTSGTGDDSENGKPRRKRKLDKPIRVSKTPGEAESEKEGGTTDAEVVEKDESQKSGDVPVAEEVVDSTVIKDEAPTIECPTSTTNIDQELCAKPEESVTVDNVSSQQESSRRRRSSESSAASPPSSGWPAAGQRIRRKSASDRHEDTGSSNSGDLLSVLVSDQNDKNTIVDAKPEVKNAFIEVETELEKMFAGIVEPENEECVDPLKLDTASPVPMETSPTTKTLESLTSVDSTNTETKPSSGIRSRGRPKGSRNGTRRSSESIFGPSSTESTPKKKKKKQAKRMADDSPSSSQQKKTKRSKLFHGENGNDRKKGVMKADVAYRDGALQSMSLYDSSSNTSSSRFRGPVIHIEGPKDNPYHVSVINAPSRGEDEDGTEKGGSKKQSGAAVRRKNKSIHNDLDYRGKVTASSSGTSGLFNSTLSARYDAHTTDRTWICVFCKNGPHSSVGGGGTSGDLFGPYLLSAPDKHDMNGDGSADERDITEEQKRSGGRNKRSLRDAHMVEQFCQKMSRKVRRSHSMDSAPVLGMVPVANCEGKEDGCYEVWVHEECAVWAAGVHVVGSRIVGLQEAVWSAIRTICSKCGEGGANVGCVRRGCEWRLHYGCAREEGWELDEDSYIARCAQHKKGVYSSEEAILPT